LVAEHRFYSFSTDATVYLIVIAGWGIAGLVSLVFAMKLRPQWFFAPIMEEQPTGRRVKQNPDWKLDFRHTWTMPFADSFRMATKTEVERNMIVQEAMGNLRVELEREVDEVATVRTGWGEIDAMLTAFASILWPVLLIVLIWAVVTDAMRESLTKKTRFRLELDRELVTSREAVDEILRAG
jgi:hypothetical protein